MSGENREAHSVGVELPFDDHTTRDEVSVQLQQVYEHVLDGQRSKAVVATEQLADQLDFAIRTTPIFHLDIIMLIPAPTAVYRKRTRPLYSPFPQVDSVPSTTSAFSTASANSRPRRFGTV